MYPNKQKDIKLLKAFKERKFIDAKMAGYITEQGFFVGMPGMMGFYRMKVSNEPDKGNR